MQSTHEGDLSGQAGMPGHSSLYDGAAKAAAGPRLEAEEVVNRLVTSLVGCWVEHWRSKTCILEEMMQHCQSGVGLTVGIMKSHAEEPTVAIRS